MIVRREEHNNKKSITLLPRSASMEHQLCGTDVTSRKDQDEHCLYYVLLDFWKNKCIAPIYKGQQFSLDLQTASGRNSLLLLTTLLGARVRHDTVERTFFYLTQSGLLEWSRLLRPDADDYRAVLAILHREYQAVTNKKKKANALFYNAQRIETKWSGDIHHVYERHKHNAEAFVLEIQRFSHINRVAMWFIREMRAHGVWREATARATAFYDIHTRTVLKRLGLLGEDNSIEAQVAVVERLFHGDVTNVYLHGKYMCAHNDIIVCNTQCPVRFRCSFWHERKS